MTATNREYCWAHIRYRLWWCIAQLVIDKNKYTTGRIILSAVLYRYQLIVMSKEHHHLLGEAAPLSVVNIELFSKQRDETDQCKLTRQAQLVLVGSCTQWTMLIRRRMTYTHQLLLHSLLQCYHALLLLLLLLPGFSDWSANAISNIGPRLSPYLCCILVVPFSNFAGYLIYHQSLSQSYISVQCYTHHHNICNITMAEAFHWFISFMFRWLHFKFTHKSLSDYCKCYFSCCTRVCMDVQKDFSLCGHRHKVICPQRYINAGNTNTCSMTTRANGHVKVTCSNNKPLLSGQCCGSHHTTVLK